MSDQEIPPQSWESTSDTRQVAYVAVSNTATETRRKNLFFASAFIGFVWMLFHFTVVYFFTLELKSPLLVGLFLGLWSLVALCIDVPVAILQRYFPPKKLFLFAGVSMLLAGGIFFKLIHYSTLYSGDGGSGFDTILGFFLGNGLNLLLLVAAACLYGFTKEVNDLTTLSYILNTSDPSEYGTVISRNNIFTGAGALLGLVASGFILTLSPTIAIIVLNVCIVMLLVFIFSYFDSGEKTITIADVMKLKVIAERENLEKMKEYAIWYVAKADFSKLAAEAKLIFLRPPKLESKFDPKILIPETIKEMKNIKKILSEAPIHEGLLWFLVLVLAFGFWDTFAVSFLIQFLADLPGIGGYAYLILAAIAIPAFVTQEFFIGLSRRLGKFSVIAFGLFCSGISVIGFGFTDSIVLVLLCGICNSLGYAAGMWVAQGGFLDLYNSQYAHKNNLSEIDANASASPMKIVQNLANVLGLTVGWLLLGVAGYTGFFVIFGAGLIVLAITSITYKARIKV